MLTDHVLQFATHDISLKDGFKYRGFFVINAVTLCIEMDCEDWSVRTDVLDYLLERGYGTKSLYESGEYVMDSLRFLKDNDAVVGVLQSGVFVKKENWDDFVFILESDPKIVYKMWVPFQDLLQNNVPFQIIRDDLQWNKHKIRWEYEPTSCWKPSKVSYKGRKKQLKQTIQAWVESPSMLISDKEEFIICHATEHGWESKPVMKHEDYYHTKKPSKSTTYY